MTPKPEHLDYFSGAISARDRAANATAVFRPAVDAADNGGLYAPPCLEIGGVQAYAYVRDGILVVSLHYDGANTGNASPFALYDGDLIPTVFKAGDGGDEPTWDALPEDAMTEDDARLLRKAGERAPFVIPAWVYGE
jgi:hypothetical protein